MQFLVSHWHCIIPVIAIIAALFLLRNRDEISSEKKNKKKDECVNYDTDGFGSR